MNRWIVVIIAFLIVVLALLLVPDLNAENAQNPEDSTDDGLQFEVPERMLIKGVFVGEKSETQPERVGSMRSWAEPELKSGMPCDRYEEVMHEQETGEEEACIGLSIHESSADNVEIPQAAYAETMENTGEMVNEDSSQVPSSSAPEPVRPLTPQEILLTALRDAGIEWWYPYACAQIEQESHWDPWAVSADRKDHGILQYRLQFWTEPESIYDVTAQIRKYTQQVKARIDAGLSIEEIISRHFTSDWVPAVNWQYVQDVMRWLK